MANKGYRILALVLALCLIVPCLNGTESKGDTRTGVTAHAIAAGPSWEGNPLKGMFPYSNRLPDNGFPYSMEWFNIPVSDVQKGMNEFDWEEFERQLNAIAYRGHQAAFRFYYTYPNEAGNGLGVPDFVLEHKDSNGDKLKLTEYGYEEDGLHYNNLGGKGVWPDHTNEYLLESMESFIAALGEKYDGDPRIGFVTMGLLGFWGEWHNWPYEADANFQIPTYVYKKVLDAYDKAFSKTQVLSREPKDGIDYTNYGIGFHDDSFCYSTLPESEGGADWHQLAALEAANLADRWKDNCMGGELYPQLQRIVFKNNGDKEWLLSQKENEDLVCQDWDKCVELSHTSWLLNDSISQYSTNDEGLEEEFNNAKAGSVQLGYDFQVTTSYYNENQYFGPFTLGVDIKNIGVAPFYYGNDKWPIKVGIMKGDEIVGEWMTDWALNTIPATKEDVHFETTIELPILEKENYGIYMKVINPIEAIAGKANILGFANAEQRADGWLKIGELNFKEGEDTTGETESESHPLDEEYKDITVWEQDGYICARLDHNIQHDKWNLYWDIDHNSYTGLKGGWSGYGYDYMVENYGKESKLYYYPLDGDGSWSGWTEMPADAFVWDETDGYICVRILKSMIEPRELNYPAGACYSLGYEEETIGYTETKWIDAYEWLPIKENSSLTVRYDYSYKNAENEEATSSVQTDGFVEFYDAPVLTSTDEVRSGDNHSMAITGSQEYYKGGQVKLEIANTGTEDNAYMLRAENAQKLEQLEYTQITEFKQGDTADGETGEIILKSPETFCVTNPTTYYMLKITNEKSNKEYTTYVPFRVTINAGEVSLRAYQMNVNTGEGGVSEFNPSFRVVSRVPKLMIGEDGNLHAVVGSGTLYVIDSDLDNSDMVIGGEDVHCVPTTKQGYLSNWPNSESDSDRNEYMYYAVTFMATTYHLDMLTYRFKLRPYAVLDNDEIAYQKAGAYEISIYDVAKILYEDNIMPTQSSHEFLYNHVLNIVAIKENRYNIALKMRDVLKPASAQDEKYTLFNNAYKDLMYYICLAKEYAYDRYSDRGDFRSLTKYGNSTTEEYLIKALNEAGGTQYATVSDWIYNKIQEKGFYRKINWNAKNGLYTPE